MVSSKDRESNSKFWGKYIIKFWSDICSVRKEYNQHYKTKKLYRWVSGRKCYKGCRNYWRNGAETM